MIGREFYSKLWLLVSGRRGHGLYCLLKWMEQYFWMWLLADIKFLCESPHWTKSSPNWVEHHKHSGSYTVREKQNFCCVSPGRDRSPWIFIHISRFFGIYALKSRLVFSCVHLDAALDLDSHKWLTICDILACIESNYTYSIESTLMKPAVVMLNHMEHLW